MERATMRGSFYYMLWLVHYKNCVINSREDTTLYSAGQEFCQKSDWRKWLTQVEARLVHVFPITANTRTLKPITFHGTSANSFDLKFCWSKQLSLEQNWQWPHQKSKTILWRQCGFTAENYSREQSHILPF